MLCSPSSLMYISAFFTTLVVLIFFRNIKELNFHVWIQTKHTVVDDEFK